MDEALQINPNYAEAYEEIASIHWQLHWFYGYPADSQYQLARRAVDRAIQLDDSFAEAHQTLAVIKFHRWDFQGARESHLRVSELDDNNHHFTGFLLAMCEFDSSLAASEREVNRDPFSNRLFLGVSYMYMGEYERAIAEFREGAIMYSNHASLANLIVWCLIQTGELDEARRSCDDAFNLTRGNQMAQARAGVNYAYLGEEEKARNVIDLLDVSSRKAEVYAALGDTTQARILLMEAFENRAPTLCYLKTNTYLGFRVFRSEPWFQELLRNIGFNN